MTPEPADEKTDRKPRKGMETIISRARRNILQRYLVVVKKALESGATENRMRDRLLEEGISAHNIKRLFSDVDGSSWADDLSEMDVIKSEELSHGSYSVDTGPEVLFDIGDIVRWEKTDFIVLQVNVAPDARRTYQLKRV